MTPPRQDPSSERSRDVGPVYFGEVVCFVLLRCANKICIMWVSSFPVADACCEFYGVTLDARRASEHIPHCEQNNGMSLIEDYK